jgi:hypothetical protein
MKLHNKRDIWKNRRKLIMKCAVMMKIQRHLTMKCPRNNWRCLRIKNYKKWFSIVKIFNRRINNNHIWMKFNNLIKWTKSLEIICKKIRWYNLRTTNLILILSTRNWINANLNKAKIILIKNEKIITKMNSKKQCRKIMIQMKKKNSDQN